MVTVTEPSDLRPVRDGLYDAAMAGERVWVISCDNAECKGRIEVGTDTLDDARAAAAGSGWKSDRGLLRRVLAGSTAPYDICPACSRGRRVLARGRCPHCGGMGLMEECFDCGAELPEDGDGPV